MSGLQEVTTDDLLSFQDFPATHNPTNQSYVPPLTIITDRNFDSGNQKKPEPDPEHETPTNKSFWSLEYYQQFFDVNTNDVLNRIKASVIPSRSLTLKDLVANRPDLYGPFWISITLIFTIAISGNIADYLQHANSSTYHWKYDFNLVSYAATAIVIYVTFVPAALWGLLKYSTSELESDVCPTPLELICIYGYSIFVYIPVSVLWTIQVEKLQWFLVLAAALVSGTVLVYTLLPSLRRSKYKLALLFGIISCHLLLAAGFMLYFFHVPNSSTSDNEYVVTSVPVKNMEIGKMAVENKSISGINNVQKLVMSQ